MVGHPLAIFSQSMEQRVSDLRRAFRNGLAKGLEMEREKFEQWRANVMNGVREKDAELAKLRASLAAAQDTVERYLENFQVQTDAIARSNKERDELRRECEEAKAQVDYEKQLRADNNSHLEYELAKAEHQRDVAKKERDAARAEAARLRKGFASAVLAVEAMEQELKYLGYGITENGPIGLLLADVEKARAALTEEAQRKEGEIKTP